LPNSCFSDLAFSFFCFSPTGRLRGSPCWLPSPAGDVETLRPASALTSCATANEPNPTSDVSRKIETRRDPEPAWNIEWGLLRTLSHSWSQHSISLGAPKQG